MKDDTKDVLFSFVLCWLIVTYIPPAWTWWQNGLLAAICTCLMWGGYFILKDRE